MLCGMYIYAKSENESKKISKEILNNFKEFITEIDIVENIPYWKIKGIYKIELIVNLNEDENKIRKSEKWYNFLKTISDEWENLGNNEFLASKNDLRATYISDDLELIDIFIGDDN